MRYMAALATLLFLSSACGRPPTGPVPSGDYKLYEATGSQQLAIIDSRSRAVERSMPLGSLFAASHLYTIQSTELLDVDPQTGATQSVLELPGRYQLPPMTINGVPGGLSQDGRWLVVHSQDGAATHMLVIDTTRMKVARRIDLQGDFQFDAVSNDGQRLYLIEYLNKSEYRVRLYNLATATLDANIVFDKADGVQSMVGQRLSGVASPDGHWLYSMYVRETQQPFIHALSLDGPFAFCIDLPGKGYAIDPAAYHWSLAMSQDGRRLFAANGALGVVAQIEPADNYNPSVTRLANYATPASAGKEIGAAAISADGSTLIVSGSQGVVWLDAKTLRVRQQALSDWKVQGLALSGDGSAVYAVSDSGLIAELSPSPNRALTTFSGVPGKPMALLRVDGAAS